MKKKDRLPPFTPTLNSLIDSEIYKRLTNASRVAYLLLCRQRRKFDQCEVCFRYSQAAEYMHKITWNASIKQLMKEGLVSLEQRGGLYRKTNVYRLLK